MLRRAAALVASGVQVVALLALSDDGAPAYDHDNAPRSPRSASRPSPARPDLFPDLMAAAIERRDISTWAARRGSRQHDPDDVSGSISVETLDALARTVSACYQVGTVCGKTPMPHGVRSP